MLVIDKLSTSLQRFNKNFKHLVSFNKTRLNEIIEIVYYSIIYMILTYSIGHTLNRIFPKLDEKKSNHILILEILVQGVATALCVFYIRKVAHLFHLPFSFGRFSKNKTTEYEGEIMISIIFIATQVNVIEKITWLSSKNSLN